MIRITRNYFFQLYSDMGWGGEMIKRFYAVALAAVMVILMLAGCGKDTEKAKKVKIGVTLYDQYDTFLSE